VVPTATLTHAVSDLEVSITSRVGALSFRIVTVTGILCALYLASRALWGWVGLRIVVSAEREQPLRAAEARVRTTDRPRAVSEAPKRIPAELAKRVVARNLFCPSCTPAFVDGSQAPQGSAVQFPGEVETRLPLTLVATMEAEPPGVSLATILTESGVAGAYAEQDLVMKDVQVVEIETGVVHLRNGSGYEYLKLDEERSKKSTEKSRSKPKKRRSKYEIEGAREAISCSGLSCTVKRKFVAKLMANPAQLVRQARVRPYSKEGLEGMRLSRVRRGTIPRLLGLRSGDVVQSINGLQLGSMDGAMSVYQQLRTASNLTVEFTRARKGERKQMELDVQID
jgi:general secretion pathway protein C